MPVPGFGRGNGVDTGSDTPVGRNGLFNWLFKGDVREFNWQENCNNMRISIIHMAKYRDNMPISPQPLKDKGRWSRWPAALDQEPHTSAYRTTPS